MRFFTKILVTANCFVVLSACSIFEDRKMAKGDNTTTLASDSQQSPPFCPNGTIVSPGFYENGCRKPPVCVAHDQCVDASPPYCPDGKVVNPGYTDDGCLLPPVCVKKDQCSELNPPFCPNGEIVNPGRYADGCPLPPVCVKANQCPNL